MSGERWMRAEAIAAPSIGGCIGPLKFIGPPHVLMRRTSSASAQVIAPPPAANAFTSEVAIATRS